MKKFLIAAASLAVAAAPIAASAAPFGYGHGGRTVEAVRVHDGGYRNDGSRGGGYGNWGGRYNDGRYNDGRYNDGRGAAVAAGLFGFILGAALTNDQPYYQQRCGWETQAYPGPYGSVQYQQVQVCR